MPASKPRKQRGGNGRGKAEKRPRKTSAKNIEPKTSPVIQTLQVRLKNLDRAMTGQERAAVLVERRLESSLKLQTFVDELEAKITTTARTKRLRFEDLFSLWKTMNSSIQRDLMLNQSMLASVKLLEAQQEVTRQKKNAEREMENEVNSIDPYPIEMRRELRAAFIERIAKPAQAEIMARGKAMMDSSGFPNDEEEDGGQEVDSKPA